MNVNKRATAVGTIALLCIASIIIIFSNSIPSIPESRETSEKILEIVKPILGALIKEEYITNHFIRKCAHIIEFFCLGTLLTLLFQYINKPLLWVCHIGLLTALTDETIQLFSKRGAQIQDVWLDYLSLISAVIIVWSVNKIRGYCTKKILGEKIHEK